jgi:hypothetical protein
MGIVQSFNGGLSFIIFILLISLTQCAGIAQYKVRLNNEI